MQIHELNNFTGTLGAGAYLAVDDGNDTGKLSTQQLLSATEARIDNIIAGPAPSAEEIVDARLGADGVTYPSLGDAIRDQVSDLKADINDALSPTKEHIGNLCDGQITEGYIRSNNNGTMSAPWANSGYACGIIDVTEGDYVTANFEWANNAFGNFADDNGVVKGNAKDDCRISDLDGYVYLVPSGATKLYYSFAYQTDPVATYYSNNGIVLLKGQEQIVNPIANITQYPYGGSIKKTFYADSLVLADADNKDLSTLIGGLVSKNIYTCKKSGGDFSTIVSAINYINDNDIMDAVLYVGAGTWDLIDELGDAYVESVSSSKRGLYLKNRIHIICSSKALITCKYTGSRADTIEWLSAFNAGEHGFTLENATIESDNVRYTIHDEHGYSGSTPYINKYINCRMKHTNGMYINCIGGGLGIDGYVEIRGCHFEGDATAGNPRLVYYHANNELGETSARGFIEVHDNYFDGLGTFGVLVYGDSIEMSTAYVSNNSLGSALVKSEGSYAPNDNIEMIAWNNEVRS